MEYDGENGLEFSARKLQLVSVFNVNTESMNRYFMIIRI